MTSLTTTSAADTFRAKAASRFHSAADMSLHQLVDEYVRLTDFIEKAKTPSKEVYDGFELSDEGKVAERERQIVTAAARSRFGIGFTDHDYDF